MEDRQKAAREAADMVLPPIKSIVKVAAAAMILVMIVWAVSVLAAGLAGQIADGANTPEQTGRAVAVIVLATMLGTNAVGFAANALRAAIGEIMDRRK